MDERNSGYPDVNYRQAAAIIVGLTLVAVALGAVFMFVLHYGA